MFTFKYFHIPRTLSRDYCTRALQSLEKVVPSPQQGIINLIVISSEEMAWMNEQYRGKKWPTDILTFSFRERGKRKKVKGKREDFFKNSDSVPLKPLPLPLSEGEGSGSSEVVWEIYLCPEKILLYAAERGNTYKQELESIIVHGLVHLMGYDHETEEDFARMEEVEKKIKSVMQ